MAAGVDGASERRQRLVRLAIGLILLM